MNEQQLREKAFDALCVWEDLLDRRQATHQLAEPFSPELAGLMAYWDEVGTVEMRYEAIRIADWVYAAWEFISEDDRSNWCFDWEWVPAFVSQIEWTKSGYTLPDPEAAAARALETLTP